jgi:hypothetical protein
MKKSKTAHRIIGILVGIMCLSTIFVFGAGSDSGIVAKNAPVAAAVPETTVQPQGSTAITATEAPAPAVVEAVSPSTRVASTSAVSAPAAEDPAATVSDEAVEAAKKPPGSDTITAPYDLQGKFVPDTAGPYASLSWTSDNHPSILGGYNIYRVDATSADVAPAPGKPYASVGKTTTFSDYKIELGRTYRYWVTAVSKKDGSESGASSTVDVVTMNVTPPSTPKGLAAFGIDPGVSLDWTANPELDIVGYNVYTSSSSSARGTKVNTSGPVPTNHYYYSSGNAALYYWVSAVNKFGLESAAVAAKPTISAAKLVEESDPSLVLAGTWSVECYAGPNNGKIIVAGDAGSTLKFNFTGSQVKMTAAKYWSCGSARVLIDGQVVATINEYSEATTYNVVSLNVPGLVHGNHTLTIEVLGSGNPAYPYNFVNVDSFEVR